MGLLESAAALSNRIKRSLMSNERFREAYYRAWNSAGFTSSYEHERMLADAVRMDTYFDAITRNVTERDAVVDLGTGTGVLAMFAARKCPRRVYALDHSKAMIEYARTVAAANECHNITFVAGHSSTFQPTERVDVIIQEQMGDLLFQERMIENILDLRDRALKQGGRIYPAKFEFYLEPVQLVPDKRIGFLRELNVHGLTFSSMREGQSIGDKLRFIDPSDVEYLLCEARPIYTCDLETLTLDAVPKQFSVRKPVTRAGELNGLCSYFKAIFDNDISLGTGPSDPRTRWGTPLLRVPKRSYRPGETFELSIDVPKLSEYKTWQWTIKE